MAIPAAALRIGQTILRSSKSFGRSVRSIGTDSTKRAASKIQRYDARIAYENKVQEEVNKRISNDSKTGTKKLVSAKPLERMVRGTVVKPMEALFNLISGWAIANLPGIIKAIENTVKRLRIIGASINRVFSLVGPIIRSMFNVMVAFVKNIVSFDFADTSGRIKKSQEELDYQMDALGTSLGEIKNVWGREEEELDRILASLDSGVTLNDAVKNIESGNEAVAQPMTPAVGSGSRAQTGGAGVRALLDTISFAEGTPSYGTIYGGAVVPELEAGELTIAEVLKMQDTGKVRGRNAGYARDRYNSDATGRYQFMSYTLREEIAIQDIPKSAKFTPRLQDEIILKRLERLRGINLKEVNEKGLTRKVIDQLAPEFASFPNLFGPDAKGRVGTNTSYYGQGGKTEKAITDFYNKALGNHRSTASTQAPVATGTSTSLVDKVPFSDFSKTALQGGRGSVGKTDTYDPGGTINRRGRPHMGVDIGTTREKGWYVALKIDGKVTYNAAPQGLERGAGWMVIIASGGKEYVFMHFARKSPLAVGSNYKAGTPIGEIGNTGGSHGEHLHYEVMIGGRHVDPNPYLNLLEIGKLKTTRTASSNVPMRGSSTEVASARSDTISSRRTGAGQTRTRTVVMSQKNYVMVG